MGTDIPKEHFDPDDYVRFSGRLQENLASLARTLARPGFGAGTPSIGAELELALVDDDRLPLPLNRAVWSGTLDPRVKLELDRFNLELNTTPVPLRERPFTALAGELESGLREIGHAAAVHGWRVVAIGILPTLRPNDLGGHALTDLRRFRALAAGIKRLRREPFVVEIEGEDRLSLEWDDVTLEGANTSLQIHLRVDPAQFAATYNAAQIAIAPVLACSGNSPLFLGRRLWEETRIALYRQASDDRPGALPDEWRSARVSFGHGWARRGAYELFAESVALHAPLLPIVGTEDSNAVVDAGGAPALHELRLHHGTVWRWNRSVYDPAGGGHLRIEMRALPAGPSIVDMMANTAFVVGLTLGLAPQADTLVTALTFGQARRNFYEAARHGMGAELLWPAEPPSPRTARAADLIPTLLPIARAGLLGAGVDADETDRLLGVIAARVATGRTGARWQKAVLARERTAKSDRAAAAMLERYIIGSESGRPVHEWRIE